MASRSCRNGLAPAALTAALALALAGLPAVARAADALGSSVSTDAEGDAAKLPFRGSTFSADQSTTPETLAPGVQQSRLPSYQLWLSLRPRWYFTKTLSFRARIDLTTEFLAGADTTRKRQPLWGDLWTDLFYTGIPDVVGIRSFVGLRATWPSSLTSQLRGTYVQLGLTAGAAREFKSPIGSFELGLVLVGLHPFTRSTSSGFITDGTTYDCMYGELRGAVCDRIGGAANPYFSLTTAVSARYSPIAPLSLNLSYVMVDSWLYDTVDASLTDATGGATAIPRSPTDQRFRQLSWFSASVDYDATRWLSLGIGYYVFRPVRDPDSSIGDPFWSPGGNSRIYFSATFALDQVYQSMYDRVKKGKTPATAPVALADPAAATTR